MKRILTIVLLFVLALSLFSLPVEAAISKIKVGTNVTAENLNLTLSNLGSAKKITYELTYKRKGANEGVFGSITIKGKGPVTKKITLGTCSGKVCTYHKNVTNIKIKIICKYSNGSTESKSYSIKQ